MFDWFKNVAWFMYGVLHYTRMGYENDSVSFSPHALDVDLAGKNIIITGANAGLGKQATIELARKGATVWMLCRDEERCRRAMEEIKEGNPGADLRLETVDVSSPSSIRAFVYKLREESVVCDVVINNAGVLLSKREETPDGLEVTFATNVLGPYCLVEGLAPLMSSPSPRIITVTSAGMLTQGLSLDFDNKDSYDGTKVYAQTKRMQQVLTEVWAKKYPHINFYVPHPGWVDTPGVAKSMPTFYKRMRSKLRTVEQGVDTIVWAACSEEVLETCPNGSYLQDRQAVSPHMTLAGTTPSQSQVDAFMTQLRALGERFQHDDLEFEL